MVIVGVAAVLALLLVNALLMGRIRDWESRYIVLQADHVDEIRKSADRERALAAQMADQAGYHTKATVDVITQAVERQVQVMQDSMKTAWNPQPTNPTPTGGTGNPAVDKILAKYGFSATGFNLPVPANVAEHDMIEDPTDAYLQETPEQRHMGAAMIEHTPMTDDNPTGIPGFKAAW